MSAKIMSFKAKDGAGVQDTLREALDMGFDEVVIVGIKGQEVSTSKSATVSTIVWLGCLDYLKTFMYNRMSHLE